MANDFSSNTKKKVGDFAEIFVKQLDTANPLINTVNKTTLTNPNQAFEARSGQTVYLRQPPRINAVETSDGDLTSETPNDINPGQIPATTQNRITGYVSWSAIEEAIEMGEDTMNQVAQAAVSDIMKKWELNLCYKAIISAGLAYGTPGTAIDAWSDVAGAAALMESVGVPMDGNVYYVMNPFASMNLASAQSGLSSGSNTLVDNAWKLSQISEKLGGMKMLTSTSLKSWTSGTTSDRTGALASTPTATWAAHKDTRIQTLALSGLSNALTVNPGDILEFTGTGANARSYINYASRETALGADGNPIKWRCTVVTGGTTDGSGNVTVTATNAAIYGSSGVDKQHQTISAALASGDVFTILGAAGATYQPAIFYHRDSMAIASIKLPKLYGWDVNAQSKDGMNIRFTKFSDGVTDQQKMRIDIQPVIGVVNPLAIGKGFGV